MDFPTSCLKVVSSRSQIECCKFSPSGDTLAACFNDGSVRLYTVLISPCDLVTVELKHHFKEHQSNVWYISFSKDGLYLSSCSSDHTVIIYSLSTMTVKRVLDFHSETVWSCTFSSLSMLATASQDRTVKIYDREDFDLKHSLTNFRSPVIDVSFNTQGDKLCTCTYDGDIIVWIDLQSASPIGLFVHSNASRICKFISINGSDFIIYSSDHTHSVSILDIRESIANSQLTTGTITSVDGGRNEYVDVRLSTKCFQQFNGHCNIVWSFCCCLQTMDRLRQTKVLITCSGDRTIRYKDNACMTCPYYVVY